MGPEQKQALSERMIKWHQENEHPMQGRSHSAEALRKISEAGKGRVPWNKGMPLRPETKEKLRKAMTGRTASLDTRRKLSKVTRGELNAQAKLDEESVRAILEEYARGGVSQAKLGMKFGVSQAQVYHIVNGKSWRHVYDAYHKQDE